jgi:predicted nucleic acid-binding protein
LSVTKRQKNIGRFRAYIGACEEIPIDHLIAESYSDIRLSLKQKGTPIPENDM